MSTTTSARPTSRSAFAALTLSLLATAARADVLHVPGEFPSIAFAVEAAGPGDTILIAAGTYDEQVVVTGAEGLLLRGQGKVELTGTPPDVGLVLDACVDTTVEGLRFRGQSLGLRVTGCTGVTVRRCRAEAIDEVGFDVLASTGTVLDRCVVEGAVDQALQVVNSLGGAVRRCTLRDVVAGLSVVATVALEVERLTVDDTAGGAGLFLGPGTVGVQVQRSRFLRVASAGVFVIGDGNSFSRNLVLESSLAGFEFSAIAGSNVLDRDRVVRSGGTAFDLGGSAQQARGCRAVDAGDVGVLCADAGGHLVQDARVAKPGSYGILVNGASDDCVLLDSRVAGAPENGIETAGDRAILSGNVSSGSGVNGFQVNSSFNTLTGNRASGSGEFDLRDLVGASAYADNDFGTVSFP